MYTIRGSVRSHVRFGEWVGQNGIWYLYSGLCFRSSVVTKLESSDLFLVRSDMCSGCIALELRLLRAYIRLHTPHVQSTKYRHLAMSRHDMDFSAVPRHVTCSDGRLYL
jgi:hypothetical protein